MKKKYVKPMIIIEKFSLSTSIAGDCESDPVGNPARGTCAVIGSGDIYMFSSSVSQCDFESSTDEYDGFCYHVPTEYNNLFNS